MRRLNLTMLRRFRLLPLILVPLVFVAAWAVVPPAAPVMREPASVKLVPYRDPWVNARPRFSDIDDAPLTNLLTAGYDYRTAQVTLTYDRAPKGDIFVGHISARGLKPYFAYQLKLAGRPVHGKRGWAKAGDDWSNERIGYVGRWWNDENQHNSDDAEFARRYKNIRSKYRETTYGYLYMAVLVTDANGNAELDFTGDHSYHVTWQDKQNVSMRDVVAGTYESQEKPVNLWYERQNDRSRQVHLRRGDYRCRFLITEESFHNYFDGHEDPNGGFWMTVLASEDFDAAGKPDADTANDIVFTIGKK